MIWTKKYFAFVIIVIANVVLKISLAESPSFSFDEIISVKNTLLDFGHIKHESEWDNNPPFYYYCLWVWHKLLPVSEFNTRLLSILFISFAIGFTFLFADKQFNRITAIFTALLLTFSNFFLFYALEGRAYSLITLLGVLSSICFFNYLKDPKYHKLFLLSFINFLLIYTHYISGLIIIIQFLFVIIYYKKLFTKVFVIQSAILISLVLLRFTKKQFLNIINFNSNGKFWLETADLNTLIESLEELYDTKVMAGVSILVLLFVLVSNFRNRYLLLGRAEVFVMFIGFFSVLVLFFIGIFKSIFLARYLIFCVPFATIFVIYQFSKIKEIGKFMLFLIASFVIYSYVPKKEVVMDYKTLTPIVKHLQRPNDYVLINTKDNSGLFAYYYEKSQFIKYNKKLDSVLASKNIYGINQISDLVDFKVNENRKLFLVQSYHKLHQQQNTLYDLLNKKFIKLYSNNSFKGIEFSVFLLNDN